MFRYLLVLPILAAVKVNLQGRFSRGRTKSLSDVCALNAMIFAALAISMTALFLRQPFPLEVLLYGMALGVCSSLFQVCYVMAFRCGPISPTTVINNFSVIIPTLMGVILFGEKISLLSVIGLFLLAISFFLIPERKGGTVNRRWLCLASAAFLFSGIINAVLLLFSRSYLAEHKQAFVVVGYAFAALFCTILSLALRGRAENLLRPDLKLIFGVGAIGVVLGIYNLMLLAGSAVVPAVVLYPGVSGLTILWITLSDKIFFRQKFTRTQLIGILIGAAAAILLNM